MRRRGRSVRAQWSLHWLWYFKGSGARHGTEGLLSVFGRAPNRCALIAVKHAMQNDASDQCRVPNGLC